MHSEVIAGASGTAHPSAQAEHLARWVLRLQAIAEHCNAAAERDLSALLLSAEAVLVDCPTSVSRWCQPSGAPALRMCRLDAGAFVDFALDLCSDQMSYIITRSTDGQALVTMALPQLGQERTCAAERLPLAIIGGLVGLLAQCFTPLLDTSPKIENRARLH